MPTTTKPRSRPGQPRTLAPSHPRTLAPSSLRPPDAARYADIFAALGAEPRLRILRLLLSAHPDGLVVGEIQTETGIPGSTLSHHLEKLKHDELVVTTREGTFIRYAANTAVLQELLGFLYAECCTRNKVVEPRRMLALCR